MLSRELCSVSLTCRQIIGEPRLRCAQVTQSPGGPQCFPAHPISSRGQPPPQSLSAASGQAPGCTTHCPEAQGRCQDTLAGGATSHPPTVQISDNLLPASGCHVMLKELFLFASYWEPLWIRDLG